MNKSFLTFSLIITLVSAYSQSTILKDRKQVAQLCDTVMRGISERNFYNTIQKLKVYSVLDTDQIDTLSYTVEKQMGSLGPVYGKILDYDFITEKLIRDYLLMRIYALKFEHSLLIFYFTFYSNGTEWKLTQFRYTHDTEILFK